MTTPITAKTVADKLRELATLARMEYPALAAQSDAEADRLDPPAPTGKTVTWNSNPYRMAERGIEYQLDGCWIPNTTRGFIDAVVLPLLADAPDGPIPDETVEKACRVQCVTGGVRWEEEPPWAGKPPEVLRWEVWDKDGERIVRCGTRETAREFIRQYHEDDVVRVVAVIADPGEGTV